MARTLIQKRDKEQLKKSGIFSEGDTVLFHKSKHSFYSPWDNEVVECKVISVLKPMPTTYRYHLEEIGDENKIYKPCLVYVNPDCLSYKEDIINEEYILSCISTLQNNTTQQCFNDTDIKLGTEDITKDIIAIREYFFNKFSRNLFSE